MIVEDILAQANALSPKKRRLFIRLVIETRDRPRLSAILAYGRRRSWATNPVRLFPIVWTFCTAIGESSHADRATIQRGEITHPGRPRPAHRCTDRRHRAISMTKAFYCHSE